jgi:general secretion pathway protein H
MRRRGNKSAPAGFSLVEILMALAVVSLVLGGATLGFRAVVRAEQRGAASKLAAAIRYSYDRAISTGAFYRLHFNLDEQSYALERAEGRVVLTREKERAGRDGRGLDQDEVAKEEERENERRYGTQAGLPKELLPPPSPRRAKFEEFKDTTLPKIQLKRIRVLSVYTPRQPEPYTRGHAYLHFFPDGHTERAVIHLGEDSQDEESQFSLIVHGLTGRVEIKAGHYVPPADFDTKGGER